jgi:hypothetical protein
VFEPAANFTNENCAPEHETVAAPVCAAAAAGKLSASVASPAAALKDFI